MFDNYDRVIYYYCKRIKRGDILEDKKGTNRLMNLILSFNALESHQQDEVIAYLQGHVAAYKLFSANKEEGVIC